MIQNDYTTEDELKFVKGLGISKFLPTQTSRRTLLKRYLAANSNRRIDTTHKGHHAIDFRVIFRYIDGELKNA